MKTNGTPFFLLAAFALSGCAGGAAGPPLAPPVVAPAPPAVPAPPAFRSSRQICGVETGRTIDLTGLGVPEGSRPRALALARDTVWVLFEPPLLVGLPREVAAPPPAAIAEFGAVEEIDLIPPPAGAAWSALSVDAGDGSVWLVAETAPGLWRKRPGRRPETVPLPATPAVRERGFRAVLAGRGSVWVAPACADSAVWRLAPSGKLLGTAFDGVAPESCSGVLLEHDWSGTAWALQPEAGAAYQLGFDLGWQPVEGFAAPVPAPEKAPLQSWFFWGGAPFGLAPGAVEGGVLLVHRAAEQVEAFRENCGADNALVDVAGDAQGWAVLTRHWLRLAEHQRETAAASTE